VDVVGERSCKKVWKLALLVPSSRVATFGCRLLSGMQNRCQSLQSLILFKIFCLIRMGQSNF
jgi:hypothetical protein